MTFARGFFCGKFFGLRVTISAAFPVSAQAQNGSSAGSGERDFRRDRHFDELRFLPEEIDNFSDQVAADAEPSHYIFVFFENFLGDKPDEGSSFHPFPQQLGAGIPQRCDFAI
jgi:hypothetical protein